MIRQADSRSSNGPRVSDVRGRSLDWIILDGSQTTMAAALSSADEALYRQALALYERGDAAAAPLLERVVAAAPDHVEARYKLANAHKEAGRLDAAAQQYREVISRDPAHAQALNNLGAVQQLQGDDGPAEASYRE